MGALLLVSYSGAFGGAERVLLECARALGDDVCVACPPGPLATRARSAQIAVLTIPERRLNLRGRPRDRLATPVRLAAHGRELRALAAALDADAVIAWGLRSAIASLALPAGTPLAIGDHDLLPGRLTARAVRAAARRARVVVVPSRTVARDLDPEGKLGDRLRIVNPGVELERFAGDRAPASPPEVLVLGALVDWKRPDLALDVAALARREIPGLRLRLVGEPLAQDRIADALSERTARPDLVGAVELAGASDRPEVALARAGVLLHCAPREPFGLAVAEALAAGCPVVVPAGGGPAEIVDDACALRYPPGDAAGAAAAIATVLGDPARATAMGLAGRRRARARFDREHSRVALAEALHALGRPARARPADPSQLTIVTVTHNSGRVLAGLLDSLARHLPGSPVIVVDSASSDDSAALARARPGVRVVALTHNAGFGTASNRGVERARTPVTALLNPDVELVDDSLLELAGEALRLGGAPRLLAPLVLSGDGRRQDTAHPAPGSAADLIRAVVPPAAVAGTAGVALAPWRARHPRRVGWAVGCALVAPTSTLRALGPFDESIFLYGEDLELGMRAARHGVETWLWPSARVVHHRAHAMVDAFSGEPFTRLARARHYAVRRAHGPGRAALDDVAQAVTFASRLALKRALGRPAARERRQLGAVMRQRHP